LWHIERDRRRELGRSGPVHSENKEDWREKQMDHGKHILDNNFTLTFLLGG